MANSKQGNQNSNQNAQSGQGGTSNRGFASMDPERQREIAAEGGRAAHAAGTAHEFTSEEARRAGAMSHGGGNQQSGSASGSRSGGGQGNSQSGNQGNSQSGNRAGGSTRGGTPEQHAAAGRQSHKNDR